MQVRTRESPWEINFREKKRGKGRGEIRKAIAKNGIRRRTGTPNCSKVTVSYFYHKEAEGKGALRKEIKRDKCPVANL